MNVEEIVRNELVHDPSGVWVLKGHERFGYSDGAASERYLRSVFESASDLSAGSAELEARIKDWTSEYHLTARRGQVVAGFDFDRTARVLEVGCGCGAITRQLGETFDQVVSIEGSLARARLARLRTRDLPGVTVLSGPFQEFRFTRPFDIIFCIGVFEYSASFVEAIDPYEEALRCFADVLGPDGVLVLAIENQFGLKYFCSSTEDHLGTRFAGIEGYHRSAGQVRTFGRQELAQRIARYFPHQRFYYPYPDYKLPDCVVSEAFLVGGDAAELVGQFRSRDYSARTLPLFDERLALLELARNGALPFFANSFVVVAGKTTKRSVDFPQAAVIYSPPARGRFRTVTRVLPDGNGEFSASKAPRAGPRVEADCLSLVPARSPWARGESLHTRVHAACLAPSATLRESFKPCGDWIRFLRTHAYAAPDGQDVLPGEFLDCIWSNYYPDAPGHAAFIDREWVWKEPLSLKIVVIRAIYYFLQGVEGAGELPPVLRRRSGRTLISSIASSLGIELQRRDFDGFVSLEARFQSTVYGVERGRQSNALRTYLANRRVLAALRRTRRLVQSGVSRVTERLGG